MGQWMVMIITIIIIFFNKYVNSISHGMEYQSLFLILLILLLLFCEKITFGIPKVYWYIYSEC